MHVSWPAAVTVSQWNLGRHSLFESSGISYSWDAIWTVTVEGGLNNRSNGKSLPVDRVAQISFISY